MKKKSIKKKRYNFTLNEDFHIMLKREAKKRRMSMSDLLERSSIEGLKKK